MTTPDTSAVRAWARSNGYEVANRGRLPAEVTDAYLAAQRKPAKKAPAKTAPATKTAARKAPAKRTTKAGAAAQPVETPLDKPSMAETVGEPLKDTTDVSKPAATTKAAPAPKPSPVTDDRRLVALGEQLAALTDRVAKLEAAAGKSGNGGRAPRFRRSR